jgi:mannose-1-phosphate guanylyltransferase
MHLILLSGGSGKRLWPLSNGVRSKQFLKVLRADDGGMESMVGRICRQMAGMSRIEWDSVTVIAGESQRDQLMVQMDAHADILIEPERRDTFPAIAYAAAWLYGEKGVGKDDIIAVMPVDPYVEPHYFDRIAAIEDDIIRTGADIVLLGSKPNHPTEKFGYIIVDNGGETAFLSKPVRGFREKPPMLEAQKLIGEGALWNCGVFGMRLGYVLDFLEKHYAIRKFDREYMTRAFYSLPKISFDYEVVESAKNIRVIEYDGSWKDLGTWESLTEEMDENVIGNVIRDDTCLRSHIINELDIPVVVLGIHDAVVVVSHDGVLVTSKDETYRLKDVIGSIDSRPMYEKKRWGEYLVLNRSDSESGNTLTKKLILNKGKQISYQVHFGRKEIWTIIRGCGVLYLDGVKREIHEGDTVSIEVGTKHGLHALTELELIEIQFGDALVEEDIERLEFDWDPETGGIS